MKNALTLARESQTPEGPKPIDPEGPTLHETSSALFKYKYDGVANALTGAINFGLAPRREDNTYIAVDNIPDDLRQFSSTLVKAKSAEHMSFLIGNIRESFNTREVLDRSGVIPQLVLEAVDPVNWIALPFRAAKTIVSGALRAGTSSAAVSIGQEGLRQLDPTATVVESGLNIGASFILGNAMGGLVSINPVRKIKAQQDATFAITDMKKAFDASETIDPNIAESIFTDSWIYKAATTPIKRTLTNPDVPNTVKLRTLELANDSGILLVANKNGKKVGNSVFQEAKLHEATWVMAHDDLVVLYGKATKQNILNPMDYMPKRKEFDEWLTGMDRKAIKRQQPSNEFEAQAIERLNRFYNEWEIKLRNEGLIGSQGFYKNKIIERQKRLDSTLKRLSNTKNDTYARNLNNQIDRFKREISEYKMQLDDIKKMGEITPPNEDIFRPRYWDFAAIEKNKDAFRKILAQWYTDNPTTFKQDKNGVFKEVEFSTDPELVLRRVEETIDGMLNNKDPLDLDTMYYGMGKSKHFKHRSLDIPNELVLDFMSTNPTQIMKAYTSRTASRYEFSRKFNGQSIDDYLDDTFNDMMDAGLSIEEIRKVQKDQRHLYDRIAGSVIKNPDRMNQKAGRVLRTLAQFSYLGSAGLATVTEPAKIIMEHGLGPSLRGLFSVLEDNKLKMGASEVRATGEAIENLSGSNQMRLVEDLNNNPLRADVFDKATEAFYLLNLLGPITRLLKDFDGMMRSHTLIDYSVRWTQGKATKMEQEYLLRYNIDLEIATKIANAPWERGKSGLYMANTEAWTDTIQFPATTAKVISGNTNTYNPVKAEPKPSIDSKVSKLKERADEILDEEISITETRNKVRNIETGFEKDLVDARILRGTTITSLNKNADEIKQVSKESQDFYESMQSGFDPDDKLLKNILEKERKLTQTAVNLKQELEALDESIKNLEASRTGSDRLREIEDSVSKSAKKVEELSNERVAIESEISVREFLQENKIDYDDLSNGLRERASNLAEEDYFLNNRMDDGGDYSAINAEAQEKNFKKKVSNFKADAKAEIDALPKPKGRYSPAFYNAKSNTINIDEEYIKDVMYDLRGWENPRVEGVTPIKEGIINSPDDYVAFIKMHEVMHSLNSAKSLGFDRKTKQGLADYENAINDLAVAEIEKQPRIGSETVREFRNALGSGVMNTILMGTPADKPIITDGIVYIPMRVAKQFGMKEDPAYKGYARIENGMLGLPFQFMSYSLAAINKTMGAYAHGQLKSQYVGTAIAMGLGYVALEMKTPDWLELSFQDKFARSLDYSGIMPLYSDMFYTAMATSLALGGENLTGGILQEKFPQEPDVIDAVTGILGAGPSVATDLSRSMIKMVTGDVGEGMGDFVSDLPFTGLWFIKGKMNQFSNFLKDQDEGDGPKRFGRY